MASGALEAAEPEGAAAPPPVEGKEEELPEKLEVEEIEPWFRFWSSEISKDQSFEALNQHAVAVVVDPI
ncbi:hypothetical protein NL676_018208 [Syzygium grande]|nr:hypothetical protein NL676_018208 [Syzygium grande]